MDRRSSLYRLPGIGEVAANVRTNYAAPLHSHDTYSIGIFKGAARIWCRGRDWDVGAGTIVVLEPGEAHSGSPLSRHCLQDVILPEPAFMVEAFGSAAPFSLPEHIIADSPLANAFSLAAAKGDAAELGAAIRRLFADHGRQRSPQAQPEGDYADAVVTTGTVTAASRRQGVSRSHFSRTLKAQTGLSPRDLRRQLRVARARILIENGETLVSAALRAGFADQAHMTRQLRSLLGVTPHALRKARKAVGPL